VAEGAQLLQHRLGDGVLLERRSVWQPLVVHARRVDGGPAVHAVGHDVQHDVEDGVDDRAASRRAGHEDQPAAPGDDGRRHRAEHSLARLDEIRRRADVARDVGLARLLVEVAHLVVEQEAGALDDDPRAVPALQRVRAADRHAVPVDDGKMGRLATLAVVRDRDDVAAQLDAARRFRLVDAARQVGGVFLGGQPGNRDIGEIRIAEMSGAIEVGAAAGLDQQVERPRREALVRLQIERFEDVEHLDERHAARAGRRHGDDLVAEEGAADRRPLLGLVKGPLNGGRVHVSIGRLASRAFGNSNFRFI